MKQDQRSKTARVAAVMLMAHARRVAWLNSDSDKPCPSKVTREVARVAVYARTMYERINNQLKGN